MSDCLSEVVCFLVVLLLLVLGFCALFVVNICLTCWLAVGLTS